MKEKLIEKPEWFKTIEAVPVLEASDICRKKFTDHTTGTHCLLGWVNLISSDFDTREFIRRKLQDEIKIFTGKTMDVPEFNDNTKNDKRTIARLFNRVMRKLGFTEIVDR